MPGRALQQRQRELKPRVPLQYLVFDFSDEASGSGSFDAMASVTPDRLTALLAEVSGVLRWAHGTFGPAGVPGEEADWDFDLQGVAEPDAPLDIRYDEAGGGVLLGPPAGAGRTTVTLTLSGSPGFCESFCAEFGLED